MQIQATEFWCLQNSSGQQEPVRNDQPNVRAMTLKNGLRFLVFQCRRSEDWDAKRFGGCVDRCLPEFEASSSSWLRRAGIHGDDFVTVPNNLLQRRDGEFRCAKENDPHFTAIPSAKSIVKSANTNGRSAFKLQEVANEGGAEWRSLDCALRYVTSTFGPGRDRPGPETNLR